MMMQTVKVKLQEIKCIKLKVLLKNEFLLQAGRVIKDPPLVQSLRCDWPAAVEGGA